MSLLTGVITTNKYDNSAGKISDVRIQTCRDITKMLTLWFVLNLNDFENLVTEKLL